MPKKGSGAGFGRHDKGYLRCWRRGPDYGRLAHRMVMARVCAEFCYYPLAADGLPSGFDLHHIDFDKTHNCPSNLLLLEHTFHYYADQDRRAYNCSLARASDAELINFEDLDD